MAKDIDNAGVMVAQRRRAAVLARGWGARAKPADVRELQAMTKTHKAKASAATVRRTRLDIPCDRQGRAVVELFQSGFAAWEVAALLRWSEHAVLDVLRKAVR